MTGEGRDGKSEFSRPVQVAKLGLQDYNQNIKPRGQEFEALAARLQIDRLDSLNAELSLKLLPNNDVVVEGRYTAHLTQTCGVTLEPVESDVSEEFSITYSETAEEYFGAEEEEEAEHALELEPSEPIVDGTIDIGEAVIQQLALEIDPFPRVKGATFDGFSAGVSGDDEPVEEKKNPFAVLSKLKDASEKSE
ncbi:DUF177 domain-containing protein [Magnetovibrio sp. PR-2]|uniref:YceD family protein n=1 Tax=Magnetovibrio sp. PR-2 TaxID=3120356 RepID=UPI002FCDFADC